MLINRTGGIEWKYTAAYPVEQISSEQITLSFPVLHAERRFTGVRGAESLQILTSVKIADL